MLNRDREAAGTSFAELEGDAGTNGRQDPRSRRRPLTKSDSADAPESRSHSCRLVLLTYTPHSY